MWTNATSILASTVFFCLCCFGTNAELSSPLSGWEMVKAEIPSTMDDCLHYEFSLKHKETGTTFLLGRLFYKKERNDYIEDSGLNEESLSFEWLDPDKVLLVSWATCPRGQGTNTMQTHLVLARDGAAWRQAYRHTQEEYSRDYSLIRCNFTYDSATKELGIHEEDASEALRIAGARWRGNELPQGPLNGGEVIYFYDWRFRLKAGKLEYINGTKKMDLDLRDFHVWAPEEETREPQYYDIHEVARFVDSKNQKKVVKRLRRLNSTLKESDECTGVIMVDDKAAWRGTDEGVYY